MDRVEIAKCVGAAITLICLIIKIISQNSKNKKLQKLSVILDEMQKLCDEAEHYSNDKDAKKNYVLLGIEYLCSKAKVDYDEDYWSGVIDNFIAHTKKINYERDQK